MPEVSDAEQGQLPWTRDRFIPGEGGDIIALEHIHRYTVVQGLCRANAVLDLGCGSGYGASMLLGAGAAKVVGVDISFQAASFVSRIDAHLLIATSRNLSSRLRHFSGFRRRIGCGLRVGLGC